MVVDPRDEVVGAHLVHGKPWEPYETQLFIDSVKSGMTVVDIGANIGYYTLLAARAVGPRGVVVAIEPDPVNFTLLSRNVARNGFGNRVILKQCAVTHRNGTVILFKDRNNFGAHSFAEDNLLSAGSVEVPCSTLAHALAVHGLESADLIKLDVQGVEGLIFDGAKEWFLSGPVQVFMEYWPSGLRRMGRDPAKILRILASDFEFELSWIDEEHSRVVGSVDPEQ